MAEPLSPGPDELVKFIKSGTGKWGAINHKVDNLFSRLTP
jgi:hypothetical protein